MEIVTLRQSRCFENGNDDFGVETFWAIHCAHWTSGFKVLNASISRVLGQRPTFYCPLFVLFLGRVRISILQCNQCTMFIRKKIYIIILQAVDGATVVAMGHRCSNRSQHFLSLSTVRWCHRYGILISSRDRGRSVACWTFTGRVFHPAQRRPLDGHAPSTILY